MICLFYFSWFIIHGIFGGGDATQPCMMEHSFKTQILVDSGPVDATERELEASPLCRTGISESRPKVKLIGGLHAFGRQGIDSVVIHPNLIYLHPVHFCLKNSFHRSIITSSFSSIRDSIKESSCFLKPWL